MKKLKLLSLGCLIVTGSAFADYYNESTTDKLFNARADVRDVRTSLSQALREISKTVPRLQNINSEMDYIDNDIERIIPYGNRGRRNDRLDYQRRGEVLSTLENLEQVRAELAAAHRDAADTIERIANAKVNLRNSIQTMRELLNERPERRPVVRPRPRPRPRPVVRPRPRPERHQPPVVIINPIPVNPNQIVVKYYRNHNCDPGRDGKGLASNTTFSRSFHENNRVCASTGALSSTMGKSIPKYSINGACYDVGHSATLFDACNIAKEELARMINRGEL